MIRCGICGCILPSGTNWEVATARAYQEFPVHVISQGVIQTCDDCYDHAVEWAKKNRPELLNRKEDSNLPHVN